MSSPDFSDAILMQYETPLPDDFDMDGIRTRVREKAGVWNARLRYRLLVLDSSTQILDSRS